MRFEKWHALGNAYLLVDQPDAGTMTAARARRFCDVRMGIGSDGLLEVVAREEQRAEIRIWNPDGSLAEMSGNGTRIAAAWLLRETGATDVEIVAPGGIVRASAAPSGLVRQRLGDVVVASDEVLDIAGERLTVVPVAVGNPHAVVLREALSRDDLLRFGPAIETHPRFGNRTNVQLARPEPRDVVSVLVWERGAGETASSGSSAVAVAAAAVARGWSDSPVRIAMPGGELVVTIEGGGATLEGPAEQICAGETPL
jgi:diaminopimelate epimerase